MAEYVAIDIETTGLSYMDDRIIEIALVRFTDSEVPTAWSSLVNPGIFVPPAILEYTHIPLADIHAAPRLDMLDQHIVGFAGSAVPVAHNAGFEEDFLDAAGIVLPMPFEDTLDLSRSLYPDLPKHTLSAMCDHLGIDYRVRHRALPDADACRRLFLTLQGLPAPPLPPPFVWQGTIERWHVTLTIQDNMPLITLKAL